MKRGQRKTTGQTKLDILSIFISNPTNQTGTKNIVLKLKEKRIEERRGCKKHLIELSKAGLLYFDKNKFLYSLPNNYRTEDYWIRLCKFFEINDKNIKKIRELASLVGKDAEIIVDCCFEHEITQKHIKDIEALSESNRQKDSFGYGILHYFNLYGGWLISFTNLKIYGNFYIELMRIKSERLKEYCEKLKTLIIIETRQKADYLKCISEKRMELFKELEKTPKRFRQAFLDIDDLIMHDLKMHGYVKVEKEKNGLKLTWNYEDVSEKQIEDARTNLKQMGNKRDIIEYRKNMEKAMKIFQKINEKENPS